MRLFISYARVDRPFCEQIVQTLEAAHEVWYDKRLHAGKKWWDQITARLAWCDGFVYLLSPESVASEYCQKEYAVARSEGKPIFPVMIRARTDIPDDLLEIQYVDCSEGLTARAVADLMAGINVTEREGWKRPAPAGGAPVEAPVLEVSEGAIAFAAALDDLEAGSYDSALFKLRQLQESGYSPGSFVDVEGLIANAQAQVDYQAFLREAEREYFPIAQMVRLAATRETGCAAFVQFREQFPDYDPDGLAEMCAEVGIGAAPRGQMADILDILPPPFEWCEIPAARQFRVLTEEGDIGTCDIDPFSMAKYPITCAQFQVFVDAADGFHNPKWWEGLAAGQDHKKQPGEQRFKVNDHPREHASWYDAVAFCRWLTAQLFPFPPSLRSWPEKGSGDDGWEIRLPTEWEWQWAAQGSDGREYPWGNGFDKSKCNTGESGIGRTTPVDNYPSGASPFGVMDMAGNVWEWCLNEYENPENIGLTGDGPRVVRGGSWFYDQYDARAVFRFSWYPAIRDNRHGFRVVVFAPTHK